MVVWLYRAATVIREFDEPILNTIKKLTLNDADITAIEVEGGGNEAAVVEVCFEGNDKISSVVGRIAGN